MIVALAACEDHVVPYFTAPTSGPNSPTGIKQAVLGFGYTRNDQSRRLCSRTSSFAREAGNFTNTDPRWIEYDLGIKPIPLVEGLVIDVGGRVRKHSRGARDPGGAAQRTSPAYSPESAQASPGLLDD